MKTPKIPELSAASSRLAALNFITPLTPEEKSACKSSLLHRSRGVCLLSTRWLVWHPFNGMQFTLSTLHMKSPDAPEKSARFSDMARMYFWRYRQRKCRPPQPGELNISVARATEDLKNETLIVDLLKEEEQILLKRGVIKPLGEESEPIKSKPTQSKTLLALSDLGQRMVNFQARLSEQEVMFKQLTERLDKQDASIRAVGECIAARLDGQLSMLGDAATRLSDLKAQQALMAQVLNAIGGRVVSSTITARSTDEKKDAASAAPAVLSSLKLNS